MTQYYCSRCLAENVSQEGEVCRVCEAETRAVDTIIPDQEEYRLPERAPLPPSRSASRISDAHKRTPMNDGLRYLNED